jgi:magnesium chelatase subunit I
VASANPEDYTNRGRIITPLKDRFGAEIRTHYPVELADEVAVIRQEATSRRRARLPARGPRAVHPRLRESTAVDQRSGVSARFSIARRRRRGRRRCTARPRRRAEAVARVVDLGRCRRRAGRQGRVRVRRGGPREGPSWTHLLRTATAETARATSAASTSAAGRRLDGGAWW